MKNERGNARKARAEYRDALKADIERLERMGCRDDALERMKGRLGCIEWLESKKDPRPLDTGTMNEYMRRNEE